MNKSVLKHEIRSMKWMLLLSVLSSLLLTILFSIYLDNSYINMFSNGLYGDQAIIQRALRDLVSLALVIFSLLSIIQVFMQFKSEKSIETGRFLKSLPVRKEEFFRIKLSIGIVNISLAFIVLVLGLVFIRNNNMFWIKDVYNISSAPEVAIKADSVLNLVKEVGLLYLVVLTFYTFIFAVQYTFTNIVGGIVTAALVWLAPTFILISSIFTLDKIGIISIYSMTLVNKLQTSAYWLLPWTYLFDFDFNTLPHGMVLGSISFISNLGTKYIVSLILILVNLAIAYNFNRKSKVENENKIIVFKSIQKFFIFGVTICSGLLVSTIFIDILMIQISNLAYILLMLLGCAIGYFISRKITQVGNV